MCGFQFEKTLITASGPCQAISFKGRFRKLGISGRLDPAAIDERILMQAVCAMWVPGERTTN